MQIRSKGSRGGSHDLLLSFATPFFISAERLKLDTSNFVCVERARSPNGSMQIRSNGVQGQGHVTYFGILGPRDFGSP